MPDIYSLLNMIKSGRADVLPHLVNNNYYSTIIGGETEWVIGGGSTKYIFSGNSETVVNFAELLRYVMGSGPGAGGLTKVLFAGLNVFLGGGPKSLVLGHREEMTYRLTPNFKVDRFHKVQGLGSINVDMGSVSDFDYTPSDLNKETDFFSRTNNNTMFLCFAFLQTLNVLIGLATVELYNHGNNILGGSDSDPTPSGSEMPEPSDDSFYKTASDFKSISGIATGLLMAIFKAFGEKPSYVAYKLRVDLYNVQQGIQDSVKEFESALGSLANEVAAAITRLSELPETTGNFYKVLKIKRQIRSLGAKITRIENALAEALVILA